VKLSTRARYGVRAVFDIAYHNSGRPTQARDTARRQGIPLRYLEQIFQELRRAHLVEAKRGPKGGYSLAREPESITQGPIDLYDTKEGSVPGSIWRELAEKVRACFDGVNLKDLCQRGVDLGIPRGQTEPHMYFI
jgi:DNA-binding IscR family transcriptional regulator